MKKTTQIKCTANNFNDKCNYHTNNPIVYKENETQLNIFDAVNKYEKSKLASNFLEFIKNNYLFEYEYDLSCIDFIEDKQYGYYLYDKEFINKFKQSINEQKNVEDIGLELFKYFLECFKYNNIQYDINNIMYNAIYIGNYEIVKYIDNLIKFNWKKLVYGNFIENSEILRYFLSKLSDDDLSIVKKNDYYNEIDQYNTDEKICNILIEFNVFSNN